MIERIIAGCIALAGTDLKVCVKQSVYAMLITAKGEVFFGANWMTNGDITVCPRVELNYVSGEGYHLCKEVCNQGFHAERFAIQACEAVGSDTVGATLYLTGHTYCCDDCRTAMFNAGITAVVLDSGTVYHN